MLSSLLCFTRGIQFPPSCHRPIHFSIRNKRAHCDQKAAQAHHVLSDFEVHATSDEKIWFSYMIGTVLLLYSTKGDLRPQLCGPTPMMSKSGDMCANSQKMYKSCHWDTTHWKGAKATHVPSMQSVCTFWKGTAHWRLLYLFSKSVQYRSGREPAIIYGYIWC